jgi:hypothetical protein
MIQNLYSSPKHPSILEERRVFRIKRFEGDNFRRSEAIFLYHVLCTYTIVPSSAKFWKILIQQRGIIREHTVSNTAGQIGKSMSFKIYIL